MTDAPTTPRPDEREELRSIAARHTYGRESDLDAQRIADDVLAAGFTRTPARGTKDDGEVTDAMVRRACAAIDWFPNDEEDARLMRAALAAALARPAEGAGT